MVVGSVAAREGVATAVAGTAVAEGEAVARAEEATEEAATAAVAMAEAETEAMMAVGTQSRGLRGRKGRLGHPSCRPKPSACSARPRRGLRREEP